MGEGHSYVEDIRSEDIASHVTSGKLAASTDERVLGEADCVILCVPTPLKKNKDPDMTFIEAAADAASALRDAGGARVDDVSGHDA